MVPRLSTKNKVARSRFPRRCSRGHQYVVLSIIHRVPVLIPLYKPWSPIHYARVSLCHKSRLVRCWIDLWPAVMASTSFIKNRKMILVCHVLWLWTRCRTNNICGAVSQHYDSQSPDDLVQDIFCWSGYNFRDHHTVRQDDGRHEGPGGGTVPYTRSWALDGQEWRGRDGVT